jgi:hypothetical protein
MKPIRSLSIIAEHQAINSDIGNSLFLTASRTTFRQPSMSSAISVGDRQMRRRDQLIEGRGHVKPGRELPEDPTVPRRQLDQDIYQLRFLSPPQRLARCHRRHRLRSGWDRSPGLALGHALSSAWCRLRRRE